MLGAAERKSHPSPVPSCSFGTCRTVLADSLVSTPKPCVCFPCLGFLWGWGADCECWSLGEGADLPVCECRNIQNCYHADLISLDLLLGEEALPRAGHGSGAGERSWGSSLTAETAGVGQGGGWHGRVG